MCTGVFPSQLLRPFEQALLSLPQHPEVPWGVLEELLGHPGPVPCSQEQLQEPERGFRGECVGCGSPAADQGNTRDCACVCPQAGGAENKSDALGDMLSAFILE